MAYNVAQLNIARMIGNSITDPKMNDFVSQLDAINALAEQSDGFIWRLKAGNSNATGLSPYNDDRIIINFSVWQSVQQLKAYVYNTAHADVMRGRKKWFEQFGKPYYALWYVNEGHIPTVDEAVKRLEHLQQHGCSAYAFDFSNIFARCLKY